MKKLIRSIGALVLVMPHLAFADSLPMNPGLWSTTYTSTNPITGAPTTKTSTECLKRESFDPESMVADAESCQVQDSTLSGDSLNFRMVCSMHGAQMSVNGVFTTDGSTGSGNMDMKMNFGGRSMTMESNWKAKRLRDC